MGLDMFIFNKNEEVCYWRKSNQIHKYFRDNILERYGEVVENFEDAILRPKVVGLKTGKIYNLARDLSCANIIVQ